MSRGDRIKVCLGVALIALIVVAIFALPALQIGRVWSWFGSVSAQREPYKVVQEQSFAADEVRSIELAWGNGDATLVVGDGDAFVVREEARPNKAGDMPQKALVRAEDGCLTVRWNKDSGTSTSTGFSGFTNGSIGGERRITIEVPRGVANKLEAVSLSGTSGTYRLEELSCQALTADLTSGDVVCNDVDAQQARITCTSGDVAVTGGLIGSLDMGLTSGDLSFNGSVTDAACLDLTTGDAKVSFAQLPRTLDVTFTSGDVELSVPKDAGFTATVERGWGDVTSDFASSDASDADGRTRVYRNGDGSAAITVALTSGDLVLSER